MHVGRFIIAAAYVALVVVTEEFLPPRTAILPCQFFADLLFDAIERLYVRTSCCLTAQLDSTNARFGLHSAECSASPMIFSWINGPNARGRKEATREKSCEKRSSRTAHTVHDRPGENFDRSGQSEFQKGSVEAGEDGEQREGGRRKQE